MSAHQRMSDWRVSMASVLVAVAVIAVVLRTFPSGNYHDPMSPSFFPLLLSYLLLICGVVLGLRAWRAREAVVEQDVESVRRYGRGALGMLILILYGFGVFHIGFWLASLLAIPALSVLLLDSPLTRRFLLVVLAIGVLTPAVVAWMFDVFAGVSMPGLGGLG